MTEIRQHFSSHVSDSFSIPLAQLRAARRETPFEKIQSKVSRYLARRVATKRLAMRNTKPIISFTFDDVPASACEVGVPIIESYGIRGTFYIAGAGCGRNSPVGMLATPDQLRTIWSRGHEIGCQTHRHAAVSQLSRRELQRELSDNHAALKDIDADIPVRNFAYPYGDLSLGSRLQLEARFDCCRSVDHGINSGVVNLGALKAWPLENASLDRSAIAALIAETVRINGWLIFFSHDVGERPSRYGVEPALLDWTVKLANQSGAAVVPISDALKHAAGSVAYAHPGSANSGRRN